MKSRQHDRHGAGLLVDDSRPHPPLRPLWLCRTCLEPWPCPAARAALLTAYDGDRVCLCVFLARQMFEADADLRALHPDDPPSMAELFRRFLHWARRYTVAGPTPTRRHQPTGALQSSAGTTPARHCQAARTGGADSDEESGGQQPRQRRPRLADGG